MTAVGEEGPPTRSRVLIVDDDVEVRHVLRLLFELESFVVVAEATDGREAVEMAALHRPDFALLDVRMPRMSGEDAAPLIRMVSSDTCIVAFSAVLQSRPPWADAFLNKDRIAEIVPVLAALIERLERDLRSRSDA
jgi:CheY-like chemotaxis protein